MNVPNHEKKAFRDMTPEERSAIVEAWLSGNAEYFSTVENEWAKKMEYSNLVPSTIYRTRPRQLVIPWDHIKPEYKWAAMDKNGKVIAHAQKPDECWDGWCSKDECGLFALNIDITGIDWRESLTARPEGV